jgi:hypothetical protein
MSSIVDHLEQGVSVVCADGTTVVCPGLMLADAKFILDQFEILAQPGDGPAAKTAKGNALLEVVSRFAVLYPDLATKIAPGDVVAVNEDGSIGGIISAFFWSATGAHVAKNGKPSIGTAPTPTIAPSGAPSPVP